MAEIPSLNGKYGFHYHLVAPTGLINDPNGLIFWNNQYHVFFQWNPDEPTHRNKHWGHLVSDDLVSWRWVSTALHPDQPYDKDGVYSGSAWSHEEDLWLFYTGNVKSADDQRSSFQCLATSQDGLSFEKKGPLFDHPEGYTAHVRDPKVWFDAQAGHYWLVLGAQRLDETGTAIVYRSDDLTTWTFHGELAPDTSIGGYMWECPDVIRLTGKDVFVWSPQGLEPHGDACHNVFQTVYQLGTFTQDGRFVADDPHSLVELDAGFEYYAPQSFVAPDGRVLQIGWMGTMFPEDEATVLTIAEGWVHALSLPRELSYYQGQLLQQPIAELQRLRTTEVRQFIKQHQVTLPLPSCQQELLFDWVAPAQDVTFVVRGAVQVRYVAAQQRLEVARINWRTHQPETRARVLRQPLTHLQFFVENSSIELFVNHGSEVFSLRYFAADDAPQTLIVQRRDEAPCHFVGYSLNSVPFIEQLVAATNH